MFGTDEAIYFRFGGLMNFGKYGSMNKLPLLHFQLNIYNV